MGEEEHTYCYNAGDHDGMTEIVHLLIIYLLAVICIIEVVLTVVLTIIGLTKVTNNYKRFKLFLLPLLVTEFTIGCTMVLLFVLDISKEGIDKECVIAPKRTFIYIYFFVTRSLAIGFNTYMTFRRMRRFLETLPEGLKPKKARPYQNFAINTSLMWSPGVASITCFGYLNEETTPVLAVSTLLFFVLTMSNTIASYVMVYRSILREREREEMESFTDTKAYRVAANFVKKSFLGFLVVNLPLFLCSIGMVVISSKSSYSKLHYIHDLYLTCITLAAFQSVFNPILFIKKTKRLKKGFKKTCCIIYFHNQIVYKKAFNLSFSKKIKEENVAEVENTQIYRMNIANSHGTGVTFEDGGGCGGGGGGSSGGARRQLMPDITLAVEHIPDDYRDDYRHS